MATPKNLTVSELRQKLRSMTNDKFNEFLQDYYPDVFRDLANEQSRAAKQTYLLDYCVREPNELARLARCLDGSELVPQFAPPTPSAVTSGTATTSQTLPPAQSSAQTPALPIRDRLLLPATLLLGLLIALGLYFGFPQPFRCILAYRLTEAIVGIIVALTGVGAIAFSNLVPMQARHILQAIYGGIAIGLLIGIVLAIISAQPDRATCGVFG
jgi:hypothetical protein